MNDRTEQIFQQVINEDCADPLRRFAELVRQDEREAIEKIVKRLRPEIVGTPNDPDSHQQWCDSAAAFSRFESVIAAIRARSKHD